MLLKNVENNGEFKPPSCFGQLKGVSLGGKTPLVGESEELVRGMHKTVQYRKQIN